MPVVAIVDGMLIMFFFNDHDPAAFSRRLRRFSRQSEYRDIENH
jgi:hypothetical protein